MRATQGIAVVAAWMTVAGCSSGNYSASGAVGDGGNASSTSDGAGTAAPSCTTDADCADVCCDGECVLLNSDASNCGQCARTCVVPQAEPLCSAGECAVEDCDQGWANCDGDVNNGCEAEVSCEDGVACDHSCGVIGVTSCSSVCSPTCELPPESCNVLDDDCNMLCDDGAIDGCRDGVHRSVGNGHYYTTDEADAVAKGYSIEVIDYFFLYTSDVADLRPFFRCTTGGGKTFLTTATDCEGLGGPQTTVGFISATAQCESVPLYRVHSASAGHFYTLSAGERDNAIANLGYTDEGVAGHVWTAL